MPARSVCPELSLQACLGAPLLLIKTLVLLDEGLALMTSFSLYYILGGLGVLGLPRVGLAGHTIQDITDDVWHGAQGLESMVRSLWLCLRVESQLSGTVRVAQQANPPPYSAKIPYGCHLEPYGE